MASVHPSAVVDRAAELADDVVVGPFCCVGPNVRLGPGNRLLSHVVLDGHTTVGRDNVFHPHCVIGGPPQDKKHRGEPTALLIGSENVFREFVTAHAGTTQDRVSNATTRVGDANLLMVNAHVAHDCAIGSRCIISNNVMLAGHVHVGDGAVLLGGAGVHHFVSIGELALVAGAARIHHDVPPFVKVSDDDVIRGANEVGMARAGFARQEIDAIETAIRRLFYGRDGSFAEALDALAAGNGDSAHVKRLIEFLRRRNQGRHGRYREALRLR